MTEEEFRHFTAFVLYFLVCAVMCGAMFAGVSIALAWLVRIAIQAW